MDWTSVVKVAIAFILLALAARSDWKTREASDLYWIVIGVVGLGFLGIQFLADDVDILYYLFLVPVAIFFLDIFWDRRGMFEEGINPVPLLMYAVAFAILGFLVYQFNSQSYLWELMIIPIMFLVFILLYQFDVIKGGADAKALIALTIMFPLYPIIGDLPLIALPMEASQFIIPFPLLILFNAALLTLVVPVVLFFYNLIKGSRKLPAMLFGYRMTVAEARKKYVWPMEYIEEGERKLTLFPRDSDLTETHLDQLAAAGAEEIWVTPKIPFLIPIAASLLLSVIVGNLLFLFIR